MATINQNFKDYMRIKKFSPNSVEAYTRNIEQCLNFIGKPENEIKSLDIMAWEETLDGYAKNTIAQHKTSVKEYFTFLTKYEIIEKNPAVNIEIPKIRESDCKQKHYMNVTDIRNMVNACKTSRDRAIVVLGASSGMRVSEFTGLTIQQYKTMRANDEHHITIVGKGNKVGKVIINAEACEYIDDYLKTRDDHGTGCDKLFLSGWGNEIARNNLNNTLKSIAKRAGIEWYKDFSCHYLRASCATINADRNVPVTQIRDMLRHSSVVTTNRYIRPSDDNVEKNVMSMSFMD